MKPPILRPVITLVATVLISTILRGQTASSAEAKATPASSPAPARIYAQALVDQLFMLKPDLVVAEINAMRAENSPSVVISSSRPERVGSPSNPEDVALYKSELTIIEPKSSDAPGGVRNIRFPLLDGNDNMVGTVLTGFKAVENKPDWEYAKDALALRDYLRRRVRFTSYLYQPEKIYSPATWTPPPYKMFCQDFVDRLLAERQDIVHLGMHARVPGLPGQGSVIVASSYPHRIGHPSGQYDTAVWKRNIVTLETPDGEAQFEVCLPILDAKNNILGTLLVEYKYYDATKRKPWEYCKEAIEIRDELKKQLQGVGDLIKRAPDS